MAIINQLPVKSIQNSLNFSEKLKQTLKTVITTMLETVLGRNKATVRVSCLIDFMKEEQTEETYLPENSVIRSEQQMSEEIGQDALIAQGIPGVASNTNPSQVARQTSTDRNHQPGHPRQDKTVNYEIGKVVKHTVLPVGRLLKSICSGGGRRQPWGFRQFASNG